ncbi:Uncharacterised protein [Mycobacteroides abscessus subsp. abscessus]|nr:Uncharacterised protein [Mycobacteroides abscessus subsp. abscessus]
MSARPTTTATPQPRTTANSTSSTTATPRRAQMRGLARSQASLMVVRSPKTDRPMVTVSIPLKMMVTSEVTKAPISWPPM